MQTAKIIKDIESVLRMQAYENGHSSGQEEVDGLFDGMMWDFHDIFADLRKIGADFDKLVAERREANWSRCVANGGVK